MFDELTLGDMSVDVIRKDIKNLHLSVHPPTGRVRIAAPRDLGLDVVRAYAISKITWIRRHQKRLAIQPRESARDYTDRESHYVWGERLLMHVEHRWGGTSVQREHGRLNLSVPRYASQEERHNLGEAWCRDELRQAAQPIMARWEGLLGVKVRALFVQRMKTKWGSCNPVTGNIRLNTELAKKPPECLEYVLLHELAHLVERTHSDAFYGLLGRPKNVAVAGCPAAAEQSTVDLTPTTDHHR